MGHIIAVDHGYGMIKTANTAFNVSITEWAYEPPIRMGHVIKYNGKYYVCGAGERQPVRDDKLIDDDYWVMTLAAIGAEIIARKMRHTKSVISLVVGLPLMQYGMKHKDFAKYFQHKGVEHDFWYNGSHMKVIIEDVHVYPQGYAAIVPYMKDLKDEVTVHIVDIGSWTVDIMSANYGRPVMDNPRSIKSGVIKCVNDIVAQVQSADGRTLSAMQVEDALWKGIGKSKLADNDKAIMRSCVERYLKGVIGKISEADYDLHSTPCYFVGGGAHLMKLYYPNKNDFADATYVDDIKVNVFGYELLLAREQKIEKIKAAQKAKRAAGK